MNRRHWIALGSGTLFGLGLAVSQMINPAKVLAFLDVAGRWDPSLALVMAAALFCMGVAWRLQARRAKHEPPAGSATNAPLASPRLNAPLVAGAVLFGIGWGLVGYCPGPALASLGVGGLKPLVFVCSMLAGMQLYRAWDQRHARRRLADASV